MGGADPRRAYAILTQWYQNAFVQAPNPSQTDMEKVRGDLQNLYHREEPHPLFCRQQHMCTRPR